MSSCLNLYTLFPKTLWLLATHPDVQKKLRAEVTPVIESNPTPDFRTLKSMEYLDHVV